MSWIRESTLTWFQRFAINVIKCGPVPKHLGFIMDGNRRFAVKKQYPNKSDGNIKGFDKISEILDWCLEVGIKECTVYAFSIDNFKRSPFEIDVIMLLAIEKFGRIMLEREQFNEKGIRIRVIGNFSMMPLDLQRNMAEGMLLTQRNTNLILNVAFAYTSRDELTESIRTIAKGVEDEELLPEDVSDALIHRCMYSGQSPDLDLLVRTSGEKRLSDFKLWQISTAILFFTNTLWPEFSVWNLLASIFYFQRHHRAMANAWRHLNIASNANETRIAAFLDKFEQIQAEHLQQLVMSKN